MVVLKVNRTPDVINAAVKERQLDLRGRDMRSIEDLGGTEDQFDTIDLSENMIIKLDNFPCLNRLGTLLASNNRINHICPNIGELLPKLHTLVLMNNDITSLAEIDPLASLPKLNSLYLLENPVTEKPDYRFYVIHRLKRLLSLDFEKVKQQERTTEEHKFHSKEAEEEVKKTFAQAYTPMKAVGAQYITEDPGPKAVSPVPAIKAWSTDQMAAERAFLKREIDMVEVLEKTDRIKGPNHENGADEQVQSGESTPIQEVKVIILNNWTIDIDQEILGAGPDSIYVTLPGHIEEYIYKNFQRTPFRFIFSWRKRLFKEMHILPLPRMQIRGDCAYNSTVTLMECHLKVLFACRPAGMCRTFNVRLSAKHLKQMVSAYYESKAGKDLKLGELLFTCLRMAERHGVVSEEDFDAGCPRKAIRYKIKSFRKLKDKEKLHIPKRLEKAEMVITSFRVTDVYRRILPHEIYRYEAPEEHIKVHPAHSVVLTSSGLEYRDLENMPGNDKIDDPEVYYEYLNSYNGWGIDGSGYIYADSIRESYVIKIAEPTHM